MTVVNRIPRVALITLSLMLFVFLAGATRTNAQFCTSITFGNNTNCVVTICLRAQPPVQCVTLNPGGAAGLFIPGGTNIGGVISAAGISYPFTPSPVPGILWVPNVTVLPSNCCVDIYFDPSTCTVKAVTTTAPPPCNP